MTRPHLALGLLLLGAAAAVGFYSSHPAPHNRRHATGADRPAPASAAAAVAPPAAGAWRMPAATPLPPDGPLAVEPAAGAATGAAGRARRIDTAARGRLELLTAQLDLSPGQQRRIYPLLVRSNPEFDDTLAIRGGIDVGPPGRIAKADAERAIRGLLDPDQLVGLEIAAAEDEVWWAQVIAKLEQDLVAATSPAADAAAAGTAPPPPGEPPAADEPRVAPRAHAGRNLFEPPTSEDP